MLLFWDTVCKHRRKNASYGTLATPANYPRHWFLRAGIDTFTKWDKLASMTKKHEQWVNELIGEDTRRIASKKADASESTLSRQLQRNSLSPEMVIALCRAYGRSPVDGIVETGYLYPHEITGAIRTGLHQAKNRDILDEINRRSDPESDRLFARGDNYINPAPDAPWPEIDNITRMPGPRALDGEVFDYENAAADGSPDEENWGDDHDFIP